MSYECPKCGEYIDDDFSFCPNCGENILIIANTIYLEEYYNSYNDNENKIKQQAKEIRDNAEKITELEKNITEHENTKESLKEKIDDETGKIRELENRLKDYEIESLFNDATNKTEENRTEEKKTEPVNINDEKNNRPDGKVNINTADADELKKIPGFNSDMINKLLQLRRNGTYIRSFDDLEHKIGIKSYHVSLIRDYVIIGNEGDYNLSDGRFIDL